MKNTIEERGVCGFGGCSIGVTNAAPGKGAPAERRQMHDPTIVSDVICAWCFLAKKNLDKALELTDAKLPVEITWRPFELNPTMPKGGIDRREYRSKKFGSWARSQALDAQVAEVGARAGIAFRHDLMARTPNTLQALARSGGDLIRALSDLQSAQLRYGHELHRYGVALGDRWAKAL